jgi:hypothetical protein
VVESGGLENRWGFAPSAGSNPVLSAIKLRSNFNKNFEKIFKERCPSWPKEHDWKSCVLSKAAPRVRIPLSPPLNTLEQWNTGILECWV